MGTTITAPLVVSDLCSNSTCCSDANSRLKLCATRESISELITLLQVFSQVLALLDVPFPAEAQLLVGSIGQTVLLLSPQGSCAEHVHHAHNILAADGTLAQLLATARAGAHVATVQDHTVHAALHADFAHILFT